MPQISFTPRNSDVYGEFKTMWLQYQLDHKCNLTAPEFLGILIGGWKELERIAKSIDVTIITSENIVDSGQVVTDFLEQHFGTKKLEL